MMHVNVWVQIRGGAAKHSMQQQVQTAAYVIVDIDPVLLVVATEELWPDGQPETSVASRQL